MTVVSIHQPGYFPWLGLLEKIACSDIFVVMDNVQYNRDAFQHRTLYSTAQGPKYLSLSVRKAGYLADGLKIRDVELADPRMPRKHFETLRQRYGRTRGWPRWREAIEGLLAEPTDSLLELNMRTIALTLEAFGIGTALRMASDLGCGGGKGELVLNLVKAAGGTTYLSGTGAQAYMDDTMFAEAGVDVVYQSFRHPLYTQSHGGDFVPGCFALEWVLEQEEEAAAEFSRQVAAARSHLVPARKA